MYKAINRAGLPTHLPTAMLKVARSTLYSWYGGIRPSTKYLTKINTLIKIANLAVEEELLPAPPALQKSRFEEAIKRYMKHKKLVK